MPAASHSQFLFTRRRLRLAAVWGLLALCMHLAGMSAGAFHATARLAAQSASDHCTVASSATDDAGQTHHGSDPSQHCPLCVFQAAPVPVLIAVLSFLVPAEGDARDYPVADKTAPPVAPQTRHAPPRAPPVLSA
ncbi:MAG TPA: DUF2946 domain-containing protein [Burkholderiales bacterium]|nr:DUF2946 domain-containing protein [Burkholderiales bacterium]